MKSLIEDEAVAGLDGELRLRSVPRDRWVLPAIDDLSQDEPDRFGGGSVGLEWALVAHGLAHRSVQAVDRAGGVNDDANLGGEGERQDHGFRIAAPALRYGWGFRASQSGIKGIEFADGRVRPADRPQCSRQRLAFLPQRSLHRVTQEMNDERLHHRLREHRGDRFGEAL